MLFRTLFARGTGETIRFTCAAEDRGGIAEPVPAKAALPEWFRRLPPVSKPHLSATNNALTVKRCMPFLDAMTAGWIIPLTATVRLEIADGGRTVNAGWEFDRTMVSNHSAPQVAGNPREPRPPCKFHNFWTITTPKGWSCLFLPPLNRPNAVFVCASGLVDTDVYAAPVHFPFFATAPDGLYVIEKGTPLVQVIPFRRKTLGHAAEIRAESAEEAAARARIHRATVAEDGWYRRASRAARDHAAVSGGEG
jgi:hypothetical protein